MRITLWCFALYVGFLGAYLLPRQSGQSSRPSSLAALKGQVGAAQRDGTVVPPKSATIYVMYASGMVGGLFSHGHDTDSAGGQYGDRLNKHLASINKQVKSLGKNGQKDEIARLYLQSVDESLSGVADWVAKHPNKGSQVKTVKPDAQGLWLVDGLTAGSYEIVVRGTIAEHDADWEGSVDLNPGETLSLPLTTPRFFRQP
jgi:hypothetical protein